MSNYYEDTIQELRERVSIQESTIDAQRTHINGLITTINGLHARIENYKSLVRHIGEISKNISSDTIYHVMSSELPSRHPSVVSVKRHDYKLEVTVKVYFDHDDLTEEDMFIASTNKFMYSTGESDVIFVYKVSHWAQHGASPNIDMMYSPADKSQLLHILNSVLEETNADYVTNVFGITIA